MSERMPDFRMPSDDEVAAERAEHAEPGETAEAPDAPDASAGESESAPRPSRRRRLVIAGVAAGALVVGGLAIGVPILTAPSPQAIVDDYAAAIESGDAAAAAELWTPDASEVELALLAEAEPTQTPTFACEPVVVDGDAATAACMLELDLEPTAIGGPVDLALSRDAAGWRITAGAEGRGSLFLALGEVTSVAGIPVREDAGVTNEPLLLPGAYDVEVAVSPLLEQPDGVQALVVTPGGGSLRLGLEPAERVRDAADAFAIEHIEACVAAGDALGDCDVPRFDASQELGATLVPERSGIGVGAVALHVIDVGPVGAPPQVRVTVMIRFAADGSGYELTLESVSQEEAQP